MIDKLKFPFVKVPRAINGKERMHPLIQIIAFDM